MSIGGTYQNTLLDITFNGALTPYVKLHIGDPGEAGTANPAAETTRKLASFSAASGGYVVSDTTLTWTAVVATEIYTHVSIWDNVTVGTHLWYGPMLAPYLVNAGDAAVIPASGLVVGLY